MITATVLTIEGPAEGTNEYRLMFETIVEGFGLMLVGLAVSGTDIQDQDIRQGDTVVLEHNPTSGVYVHTVDMEARPSTSMPTIIEEPEPPVELAFVVRATVPAGAAQATSEKLEQALEQYVSDVAHEAADWDGWSVHSSPNPPARMSLPTWAQLAQELEERDDEGDKGAT
jgi:hypothetical protein